MIHHFNFNGQDSRDYHVYITNKNVYDKAEKDVSFIAIPGRDGDIIFDNGGYKNIDVVLSLRLIVPQIEQETSDFDFYCNRALNWLTQTSGYYTYYDSYDSDHYRKACIKSGVKLTQVRKDVADFQITLCCKPFRYRFDGDYSIELITNYSQLYNPEQFSSKPYMKITPVDGTTDFSIAVNNITYAFYRADGYVEIDSDTMNVYKGNVNKNNDYAATSFPEFKPGTNSIAFVGNISSIEIIPRWRTL